MGRMVWMARSARAMQMVTEHGVNVGVRTYRNSLLANAS
jgi:hypothetical protein